MPIYAYACDSPHDPAVRQMEAIRRNPAFVRQAAVGEFVDDANAWHCPWLERPAVKRLLDVLKPGDVVVVASGGAMYTSIPDLSAALDRLAAVGAEVRWLKEGLTIPASGLVAEAAKAILGLTEYLNWSYRSEAIAFALAERRAAGRKYCRHAPYGFRWVGPKGRQRLEPIPYEQQTIARIVDWRRRGYSIEAIYYHLRTHNVHTPEGREWSGDRIRRVCVAQARQPLPDAAPVAV
jgi:hypothetical protein